MSKNIYQFIPEKFNYLTTTKKIVYDGVNLKTAFIINIIHELILKYYFTGKESIDFNISDDNSFNLWSLILRKKYGMYYNKYINYLIENGFMTMISNYYVSKKAKTYRLNYFDPESIKRVIVIDNTLSKKFERGYIEDSISSHSSSPIDPEIRKRLVDDLYHIEINYNKSLSYLNSLKSNNYISLDKYYKNYNSIDSINNNYLFFKFDDYGRFHTNFTILKRHIRQNFLTIDGDEVYEIDIKNSQPFFLSMLLNTEKDPNDEEIKRYTELVKSGIFYDYFVDKFKVSRSDVKVMIYKVFYGFNGVKSFENKMFKKVFPKIYSYILDYKKVNDDYRYLSHKLQRMESDFIFGKVIKEIYEKHPEIRLFTVHDSIIFPYKYKKTIEAIYNKRLKEL